MAHPTYVENVFYPPTPSQWRTHAVSLAPDEFTGQVECPLKKAGIAVMRCAEAQERGCRCAAMASAKDIEHVRQAQGQAKELPPCQICGEPVQQEKSVYCSRQCSAVGRSHVSRYAKAKKTGQAWLGYVPQKRARRKKAAPFWVDITQKNGKVRKVLIEPGVEVVG